MDNVIVVLMTILLFGMALGVGWILLILPITIIEGIDSAVDSGRAENEKL